MLLCFVCHALVLEPVCSHLTYTSRILQLNMTSASLSKAVQDLKEQAEWTGHCMQTATAIETVTATAVAVASGWLQIDGLLEGPICPRCNSSSCTSLASRRKDAMHTYKEQTEQLRETAAMLRNSFQTVALGTPTACCCLQQAMRHPGVTCPCMSVVMSSIVLPVRHPCVICVCLSTCHRCVIYRSMYYE